MANIYVRSAEKQIGGINYRLLTFLFVGKYYDGI